MSKIVSETDIKTAIDDLVDKLTASEKFNKKIQEENHGMTEQIFSLAVEIKELKKERLTWSETAQLREKELDAYKQRKVVGKETIEDYFGMIFEKSIDEFLGHLHRTKRQEAESLLSLTEKQRKIITKLRKEQDNNMCSFMQKFHEENDDGLGVPS